MKRTAKYSLVVLLLAPLALVTLGLHTWYFKPLKIDWFYTRIFAAFAIDSPEMLSSMGVLPEWADFHSDDFDDASPAAELEMAKQVTDSLAMLKSYDRAQLDRNGQLSYDVLAYYLQSQADGEPYTFHSYPVNQMRGVQTDLPNFMVQVHQIDSLDQAQSYIARMNKYPLKFDQVQESLMLRESKGIVPPRFALEKSIMQMQEFSSQPVLQNPLYVNMRDKLAKIPKEQIDEATRAELLASTSAAIENSVYPAYQKLNTYVTVLAAKAKGNHGVWSLPDGEAYYAWTVRHHTTTDMTPKQVHELGLVEVERVGAEMDAILKSQGLVEGSIGARTQQLAQDPAQQFANTDEGKQAMLARYQSIVDDIDKGLAMAFDLRPKLGVIVKAVPKAAEASSSPYYIQGSYDGSRPGIFYVNMRAPGDTPKFAMRTLAYHEGIPGHHFQVSIANQLEDVPFFRTVVQFTAFEEGWGLYAERLAYELGYGTEPLDKLGRLQAEMMRASRLVLDSGIHYKRWSREQAIAYMMEKTGKAEADVTTEVERYFVNPGQALAYQAGMIKILALREHARQQLGYKFDLKQFHNQVLSHGSLPLSVLEQVINEWIESEKR